MAWELPILAAKDHDIWKWLLQYLAWTILVRKMAGEQREGPFSHSSNLVVQVTITRNVVCCHLLTGPSGLLCTIGQKSGFGILCGILTGLELFTPPPPPHLVSFSLVVDVSVPSR